MNASRPALPRHIVRSALTEEIIVGIDALVVSSIEDLSELDRITLRDALDLVQHLNLTAPHKSESRRVLIIEEEGKSRAIIVGEHVRIEKIEANKCQRLPSFLETLAQTAGLDAVFQHDDALGYIISTKVLIAVGRNGGEG